MSDKEEKPQFEELPENANSGLLSEYWYFLKHKKKLWMAPIILLLLLLGVLVILGGTSAAPFIYTLF